jgi:heterogeneous nuclear ribonucleoprotein K
MRGTDIGGLPGPVTTQQVSIPADLAGVIIGKSGAKIKQIRVDSGAEVELSDGAGGQSDRIITITGTLQQIQTAQYLLQMTVKQHLERERN